MTKTLLFMTLATIAGVAGDLLLSKGMKDIGDASDLQLKTTVPFILKVMSSPKIWLGTACLAAFFFIWITVLSWAELSFALPLQALTFIITPILAQMYLNEQVCAIRWTGTILISIGVALVTWKS